MLAIRQALIPCVLLAALYTIALGIGAGVGARQREGLVAQAHAAAITVATGSVPPTGSTTPTETPTPTPTPVPAPATELPEPAAVTAGAPAVEPAPPAGVQPPADAPTEEPTVQPQLPLEHSQMVVFYGSPVSSGLGILGTFEPDEAAARVKAQAALFDEKNGDRGARGAMDLIYALVQDEPTDNGLYLRYLPDDVVQRYIDVAEREDVDLILDLQIGRGDILTEVRKVERFLLNPRVHVAIDPEYAVGPYGEPIVTPGRISGHEINDVQQYIDNLVRDHGLPPKLVVVHQYLADTVIDGDATTTFPNVDLVFNMDAFGPADEKIDRYHMFTSRPHARRAGFNVFLKHDERVLSEQEVLDIAPEPDMIFYQ